jgi:hypothetical protein
LKLSSADRTTCLNKSLFTRNFARPGDLATITSRFVIDKMPDESLPLLSDSSSALLTPLVRYFNFISLFPVAMTPNIPHT